MRNVWREDWRETLSDFSLLLWRFELDWVLVVGLVGKHALAVPFTWFFLLFFVFGFFAEIGDGGFYLVS